MQHAGAVYDENDRKSKRVHVAATITGGDWKRWAFA